jgi:hypothetical protein
MMTGRRIVAVRGSGYDEIRVLIHHGAAMARTVKPPLPRHHRAACLHAVDDDRNIGSAWYDDRRAVISAGFVGHGGRNGAKR